MHNAVKPLVDVYISMYVNLPFQIQGPSLKHLHTSTHKSPPHRHTPTPKYIHFILDCTYVRTYKQTPGWVVGQLLLNMGRYSKTPNHAMLDHPMWCVAKARYDTVWSTLWGVNQHN